MREPRPWQRKSNSVWYVTINGTQHRLGTDKKAAFDAYHALMMTRGHVGHEESISARWLLSRYWNAAKKKLAPATLATRETLLRKFGETLPDDLLASEIQPYHVTAWLDQSTLADTTQTDRISLIKTVWNWGVRQGLLKENPLKGMETPGRSSDRDPLPKERWNELLSLIRDQEFRDYVNFMLLTGCRAQEIHKLTAEFFDGEKFTLPLRESKGKKRKRVLFLHPEALAIANRLVAKYPEGALFRNRHGVPFNRNSVRCRFKWLAKKMQFPGLCATTLRHSYCHARLTEGMDSLAVAKLMGHVDGRMVATRYGHLENANEYMTAAASFSFPSEAQG